MYQKQDICLFINPSNCQILSKIGDSFALKLGTSLGIHLRLKQKFNYVQLKLDKEKLYESIDRNVKGNLVIVQDDEKLKCDLKRHRLTDMHNYQPNDVLTEQQYSSIKGFRGKKDR